MSADQSANHIAERAANRNRRVKNRHDAAPCFDRVNIRQDGRRSRAVAAFANSNANASRKKNGKRRRQPGAAAGQAPQNHSRADDDPARDPIGEKTENRCADHVSNEKRVAEQTGLRHSVDVASCEKTRADVGLERSQNLPVDVIKQIDPEEKQQRGVCAVDRSLHATFHRQLPIAERHGLIVNDKQWLRCPPPNARSTFFVDRWCVAFTE